MKRRLGVSKKRGALKGVLRQRGGGLEGHLNLGDALSGGGKHEEAINVLQRGIALHADCAEMHNNLATALLMAGRCSEAIAAFGKTTALKPNDPNVWSNLASALVEQG